MIFVKVGKIKARLFKIDIIVEMKVEVFDMGFTFALGCKLNPNKM